MDQTSMPRIIVATDGSAGANRAVDVAARFAKGLGAELTILTVGGNMAGAELRKLAGAGGDVSEALQSTSSQILSQAQKRARRVGLTALKLRCEWGDPAEMIIETVRRRKADILVVGRRGRSRISGLLLGSVSQKLASLAPCVVVVVP